MEYTIHSSNEKEETTMTRTAIRIDSGHDVNSNPKRAYIVFEAGGSCAIDAVDEKFNGRDALEEKYPEFAQTRVIETFKVSRAEYNKRLREFKF